MIEDLELPNPVIRSHYGNGFIKQYVRDHLCLRTESATNDVTDYGVKKAVENLPELHEKLVSICDNYLTVQQDILETFVDRGQLRKLAQPTVLRCGKRIPGLKLDNARQLALMHALVRFAYIAACFLTRPPVRPLIPNNRVVTRASFASFACNTHFCSPLFRGKLPPPVVWEVPKTFLRPSFVWHERSLLRRCDALRRRCYLPWPKSIT